MATTKSELTGLVLFLLVIEICMQLFLGVTTPATVLLDMFLSATNGVFSDGGFWTWITSNMTQVLGLGGAAIIIGASFRDRSQTIIWAGFALVFFSYGAVFIELQKQLSTHFSAFGTLAGGDLFALLIVLPIMVAYIITILKFWRGTD